jgi:DHA1 family tetracycline resistance protein-like MFS transporter
MARGSAIGGATTAFIVVTILLDMLAFGVIIPILPKLIRGFVDNDTAHASIAMGLIGSAWALMHFFFSPILGGLSDRFGRRPVVLISNFGMAADYVLMAVAPSLMWLFVGRLISGVTSASISTAFAYVADTTVPEQRAAIFGKMGAIVFGTGFIFGPAIGGLLGGISPRLPFWAAAGLSLANGLYGLFVLPESLPAGQRSPFQWRHANPVGALQLLCSSQMLARLSLASFFARLGHAVLPSVTVLYVTFRYDWSERTVGLALAAIGLCSIVVEGTAVGPIVRCLGERRALLLALAFGAAGLAIFGLAPTGSLAWLGIPVTSLSGISGAVGQAMMIQQVTPDQQGRLQGAMSSVASMSQLLGPLLFTFTFAYFIGANAPMKLPGAPFFLSSLLLLLALAIVGLTFARCRNRPRFVGSNRESDYTCSDK